MTDETKEESRESCKKHHHHSHTAAGGGALWCIGWLFTIGYLHLPFGKALLAIIIWPWYLGDFLRPIVGG